ncbi:MAG: ATP-binding cassette domain-containing protein [Nitriliruptoraceae bacterium]
MLELDRLTRRFGDLVALDELSFAVEPGQMFGFVGSNGAGKTTAMRIVMGLDDADDGAVRWRGEPVDRALRARFGYMPEERGLYPKTPSLRQLIYLARLHGLTRPEATAAADRLLERFGLSDRRDEPVEQLSLGNQQRVQLAAALIHDPELLILDEPFSGLDPVGVDALSEVLLERVEAGVPVVFSSHQLELVERLCHAVAIIHDGRRVASGTVDELRTRRQRPALRVVVEAENRTDWLAGLDGVRLLRRDGDEHLLELADDTDDQQVLAAARSAGRVHHFGTVLPTLSELYREVVQDPARTARPVEVGT